MLNMKPDNRTRKRKLGDIGEDIACRFLEKHGFEVIERNYLRKWGEIDIVAKKGGIIRFVEVKSVSGVTIPNVSHGTGEFRPEDNMHPGKLRRLGRTIQTYLLHKKLDCDWQLDLITIKMDMNTRKARVELLENIVI
jgi:putative endonuclease